MVESVRKIVGNSYRYCFLEALISFCGAPPVRKIWKIVIRNAGNIGLSSLSPGRRWNCLFSRTERKTIARLFRSLRSGLRRLCAVCAVAIFYPPPFKGQRLPWPDPASRDSQINKWKMEIIKKIFLTFVKDPSACVFLGRVFAYAIREFYLRDVWHVIARDS